MFSNRPGRIQFYRQKGAEESKNKDQTDRFYVTFPITQGKESRIIKKKKDPLVTAGHFEVSFYIRIKAERIYQAIESDLFEKLNYNLPNSDFSDKTKSLAMNLGKL